MSTSCSKNQNKIQSLTGGGPFEVYLPTNYSYSEKIKLELDDYYILDRKSLPSPNCRLERINSDDFYYADTSVPEQDGGTGYIRSKKSTYFISSGVISSEGAVYSTVNKDNLRNLVYECIKGGNRDVWIYK